MLKPTQMYIDLGTANTLIYIKGKGFVLREPSYLTIRNRSTHRELFALGMPSKKMLGREPLNLEVQRPLKDGVIADFDATVLMLKGFVNRARTYSNWLLPSIVISLPCRVTRPEREAVKEAALALGAREVKLIEEPMAAAIGSGLNIQEPRGHMVVDIGGGTTEIAIISCGGIIHANAVRIGGHHMDEMITDRIREKFHFLIGPQTAERLKIEGASASRTAEDYAVEAAGLDLVSGLPKRQSFRSRDISQAIEPAISQIIFEIRNALAEAPPEIAGDIQERGIILAGGGALLKGLGQRILEDVGLISRPSTDPLLSIALGGARTLSDPSLLEQIAV